LSLVSGLLWFTFGAAIGHLIPRVPFLLMPRWKAFNRQFPKHPEPVRIDPHLIQRILHMRRFHWMGLFFTIIPLLMGWYTLVAGEIMLGFGLWLAAGWTILSRCIPLMGGPSPPWTMDMAIRLQLVRDSMDEDPCCNMPSPVWELSAVRCDSCRKVLEPMYRPDLGRPRSDGFFMGMIRLWLSDGHPLIAEDSDQSNKDIA